jgi:two-component system, LytTR family, sensor kinase
MKRKTAGRLVFPAAFSFWPLQAFGWSFYFAVYAFHMLMFREAKLTNLCRMTCAMAFGFAFTSLFRLALRRVDVRRVAPGAFALRVAAGSTAAAVLWFWTTRFVSMSLLQGPAAFLEWARKGPPLRFAYPMFMDAVLFMIWSALYFTFKLGSVWELERRQAERARRIVQSTQFRTLCYQMNPHFLFNALNAARALIAEDRSKARRLVTDLSEFLRYSLEARDRRTVPLSREIEEVRRYLAIEAVRYEDRLDAAVSLDAAAAETPVPAFFLNPLVENALHRGLRGGTLPVRLSLAARVDGGVLKITVRHSGRWDDGTSVPEGDDEARLHRVRRMLESTYPGRHRIGFNRDGADATMEVELVNETDGSDEETDSGAAGR